MEVPGLTKCPNCGEMIKPHRVCKIVEVITEKIKKDTFLKREN